MAKQQQVKLEAEYESGLIRNYELGKLAQAEQIPGLFYKKAGELFAQKKDETAMIVRNIADELKNLAVCAKQDFERKYPKNY